MTRRVLIAGASGKLGRHLCHAATDAGLLVRVFGRSRARLAGLGNEQVEGDAVSGAGLDTALSDVDAVISCLGASVAPDFAAGKRSYFDVDVPANRRLIDAAKQRGIRRFVYVSVAEHERLEDLVYVAAHEAVVAHLKQSGLSYAVVRPTGFFSAFEEFLVLARKGRVPLLGDPTVRTNPIADRDLAELCVAELDNSANTERSVGGPDTFTRKHIAELAFAAVGKQPRFARVPSALVRSMLPVMGWFNPRVADITRFYLAVSSGDCVAPPYGSSRLPEHFARVAGGA